MKWPHFRSSEWGATSRLGPPSRPGSSLRQAQVAAWTLAGRRVRRWGAGGAALGTAAALLAFAPASWLAQAVQSYSGEHLILGDARGTVWSGSAVPVLTGGAGSRDAAALPGRLGWRLGWSDGAFELRLRQACCLRDEQRVRLAPGIGRLRIELPPAGGAFGQWPAAWLAGLGTPFNTLRLDGDLRLSTPGLVVQSAQGRWRVDGQLQLDLAGIASRLATLPVLGSYRLLLQGEADRGARLRLSTLDGALRLQGEGTWAGTGLRFRGDAQAAPGAERGLDNLLNIIGRRQGAQSLIAIG